MKNWILLFLLFFLVRPSISSEESENHFFNDCIKSKLEKCVPKCPKETPKSLWWDYISEQILGRKIVKGIPRPPCEAHCITFAHLACTEENYLNEGTHTFKLYEKWPLKPLGIIEEPFSMFCCLLSFIVHIILLIRFSNAAKSFSSYPFRRLYQIYYVIWSITYICSTLFHIKDTLLTERLDYYSAFIAIWYACWLGIVRCFWLTEVNQRILLSILFLIYGTYHLYYMNFVSFDYGYNMLVLALVNIFNSILWTIAAFWWDKLPHRKFNLALQASLWCMALFEIFDFPPFFGYFDPHGIWHAGVLVGTIFYSQYLIIDAKWIDQIKSKEKII